MKILLMVLFALWPSVAWACDEGDVRKGPNCINVLYGYYRIHGVVPYSTVYRGSDRTRGIVWKGSGFVKKSTSSYITVKVLTMTSVGQMEWVLVTYKWDGISYTN